MAATRNPAKPLPAHSEAPPTPLPFTANDLGFVQAGEGSWRKEVGGRPTDFRALRTVVELTPVEALQRAVFGVTDLDLAAASLLVTVPETGGEVVGAFRDGTGGPEMVGFVVGWGGFVGGRPRLVSDMLGVRADARGGGLGAELKMLQAALALGRGFAEVVWTVDPLRAANARLNFEKLGAHAARYEVDRYGAAYGAGLYGGLPTDRLHVTWPLAAPRVRDCLLGGVRPRTPAEVADLTPCDPAAVSPPDRCLVHLPADVDRLLAADPPAVARWRLTLREALQFAFARGYTITGFVPGVDPARGLAAYVLERGARGWELGAREGADVERTGEVP